MKWRNFAIVVTIFSAGAIALCFETGKYETFPLNLVCMFISGYSVIQLHKKEM